MPSNKTMHGALGIIRIDGEVVGGMYNVQISENVTRTRVNKGIGSVLAKEYPATAWEGTLSAEETFIDLNSSAWRKALKKGATSIQEYEDSIVMDSDRGIQVDIFKKIEDAYDPTTGLFTTTNEPLASVLRLMVDSMGFSVTDGQASTSNFSGSYLDPILIPQ